LYYSNVGGFICCPGDQIHKRGPLGLESLERKSENCSWIPKGKWCTRSQHMSYYI